MSESEEERGLELRCTHVPIEGGQGVQSDAGDCSENSHDSDGGRVDPVSVESGRGARQRRI